MCIVFLVLCFSQSFWRGCTPAFSLECLGGRKHTGVAVPRSRSAGQRSVWWVDVGEVHPSPCLCCGVESIQRQDNPRGNHSGDDSGCCWSLYNCHFAAWMVACCHGSLYWLLGKRIPCKAGGVPNIWYPIAKALTPADHCVSAWERWPNFHDAICGESFEGCRALGLDGV